MEKELQPEMIPEGDDTNCGGCGRCIHVIEVGFLDGKGWTCKAFPKGIMASVVLGDGEDHIGHLPHDNGYKYESKPFEYKGRMWRYDWYGISELVSDTKGA